MRIAIGIVAVIAYSAAFAGASCEAFGEAGSAARSPHSPRAFSATLPAFWSAARALRMDERLYPMSAPREARDIGCVWFMIAASTAPATELRAARGFASAAGATMILVRI